LIAAEMAVNPRVRQEIGEISLVPPHERVSGPNASWVMAAFTHQNPKGSRFSDGSYGVYYVGDGLETAVVETAYHFALFARDSRDGPRRETMRVLAGTIDKEFHDLDRVSMSARAPLLDPDSYSISQPFGGALRASGSNGIHYPSVRRQGGYCIAVFRPNAVRIPTQSRHLVYDWDGAQVRRYFDQYQNAWVQLSR